MHSKAIHGFLLDRTGHGREIEISSTDTLPVHPDHLLWVHIDYTSPEAAAWLRNCDRLDPLAVESLLEETSRPRAMLFHTDLILDLRGVNMNPGADPEDMVAVRIWADEQYIISSNRRRMSSLEDIQEELHHGDGPKNSSEFISSLVGHIDDRISLVLDQLEDAFEQLEDNLLMEEYSELRVELARLRRLAIRLKRYLAPQKDAINHLLNEPPPWLQRRDKMRLRENVNLLNRHLEELDSIRDRAIIAQEEFINRLSEQLNNKMYTLSLVATLFMPLGFLTGLLGINVGGIPGSDSKYGFMTVSGLILFLLSMQLYYLWKKKWF
ncbi:zinc transporter ZntB [Desulfopila aestuarii]|uniref:Zinc transporter n=1 Tax=Desulfopila aestuarii DSM 18488 TaxID=1121416 RepID=A0A1M7Y935_9BACT|nr:zinc transporter ZntB [Desulfopila aestuarii]SHO49038.1 zinc transporter [Desulfopila aestuarii DSM 18488]